MPRRGLRRAGVVERLDLGMLDEALRAKVCSEAQQVRGRPDAARRRIGQLWNSALWDVMPRALSLVCNRPLHVLSGDARSGQVALTVVDESGADPQTPIVLIRSGHEYGCAHYDLVTAGLA